MFIDTHCHLDFPFFDDDREAVIQRARDAGVVQMINVGCDLESSMASWELANRYPFIFATFGVHPNESDSWSDEVAAAFLEKIQEDWDAGERRVVAIGEIGLDYFRLGATKEVQQKAFREQLQFAKRVQLPVVIHCRDAFEDTIRILEEESMESVMFHCFTGDLETAERIWANEWLTSFTAIVTYPKNASLREVLQQAPAGQVLLETDAPFLPPQVMRGKRNESAFLPEWFESLELNPQMDSPCFPLSMTKTARQFFGLPEAE